MKNLRRAAWIGTYGLLALLLGAVPARSQTSFAEYNGVYTIVDDNTHAESLMRLEFIPGERDGFMVATIFGNNGRYRVFAGPIFTQGGIPVATAYLFAAKAPYQVLKHPRLSLMRLENFNQQDQCQFQLLASQEPLAFGYTCSEQGRRGSVGRATRLRR